MRGFSSFSGAAPTRPTGSKRGPISARRDESLGRAEGVKRPHGSGQLYVKWGTYYGRWRTPDGRRVNRKLGKVRARGERTVSRAPRPSGACGG